MAVTNSERWLEAQYALLGSCMVDGAAIPELIGAADPECFTGQYRQIYDAMCALFYRSRTFEEITPVTVLAELGGSAEYRKTLLDLMDAAPMRAAIPKYLEIVRDSCKLDKLRTIGQEISQAFTLGDALQNAEEITSVLSERETVKSYGPDELIESFRKRHAEAIERMPWPMDMAKDIPARPGSMVAICAEPSGGKTAFGLQLMWEVAKTKRVLFISLETDEQILFDCWSAFISGVSMGSLMDGKLSREEWKRFDDAEEQIRQRDFRIIPASGITVGGIKSLAVSHKADVVIIDYLQLIREGSTKGSRYETVTEVSLQLHIMAQTTGITVVPLCQVTNRDPQLANKPLTMHSARESGQIEQDCDVMVMLDKHVEKELIKAGVKANRIIRVVKNKRGKVFSFPARFEGQYQTFTRVTGYNPELLKLQAAGRIAKQKNKTENPEDFEQLPMDTKVPF